MRELAEVLELDECLLLLLLVVVDLLSNRQLGFITAGIHVTEVVSPEVEQELVKQLDRILLYHHLLLVLLWLRVLDLVE